MTDTVDLVSRSLSADTREKFANRIADQSRFIRSQIRQGELDNKEFAIGFELELYAVDADGQLTNMPAAAFDGHCEKELGLHNAEYNTDPTVLSERGINQQFRDLERQHRSVTAVTREADVTPVLDAMWCIPPAQGTERYLSDVTERSGFIFANNMTPSARYYAIDNDIVSHSGGTVTIDVPGATVSFPSILVESLTSSIQPHVQIPSTEDFSIYYNTAIRTLGPVLSVATNSPLLPIDLYADSIRPEDLLEETYHELRIPVFEQSINGAWEKVRFPVDISDATTVIEELENDPTCAPFLREWIVGESERSSFGDQIWEIDHKRGTYWRWLRAVIGGQPVGLGDDRSIRIEYRPIPTQPTILENIGFQCLVAGLIRGLVGTDHPIDSLPNALAEESFYSAVRDGLDASLVWITAEGERTRDSAIIYEELFSHARIGLESCDIDPSSIDRYLKPLEQRVQTDLTPSRWKLDRIRTHLAEGLSFERAVSRMHSEYIQRAATGSPIVNWE